MAKVQTGGMKRLDPLRPTLDHKTTYDGTVSEVSDVYTTESYDGDGEVEKLRFDVRCDIEEDLDLDEDHEEALLEYIHERNIDRIAEHLMMSQEDAEELAEEVREENLDKAESKGDEVEMFSYNYVTVPYFCTANLTRSAGSQNNSNLYNQLDQLGLAEPVDKDKFKLLTRDGEVVEDPEENVHEIFGDAESNEEINDALVDYLRSNMTGMKIEFMSKNSNRGEDNEYTVVGDMLDKVDDPEAEE